MKKLTKIFLLSIISIFVLSACDSKERNKATEEKIKGSAQETVGNLTDDTKLKQEGQTNRTKGDLRNTKEDVKDILTNH